MGGSDGARRWCRRSGREDDHRLVLLPYPSGLRAIQRALKSSWIAVVAGMALGLALAMRTTLRFPVFPVFGRDPWLLSSSPNLLVVAALVALGAALGFAADRAGKTSWITPFLPAGLAGAVFVPSLFSVAPFTALFSGRLLDFLLVSATLLWLWRALAPRGLSRHIATTRRIAFLGFCVHLAVGVKISHDVGLSGDEPHYLLITHSLVHDGDLRVQNNYFQEDYRNFYLGKIGPHLAANTPHSIHGIGLPILLVPGYALAGLTGSLVTLALLGAMLWRGIYLAALLLTGNQEASVLAACVFGLTSPALFLSVSVYPELPAAVIVTLVAVRLLRSELEETPLVALGWALLVATLPFFHMKFIPLAGVLWGALAFRSPRSRAPVLAAAVMGALALIAFYFVTTGSFDPTASYGRQRIFLSAIPIGLLGLFFDQEFGLLPVAPVYLIGLAALVPLLRRHFFFGVVSLLVLAVVALPGAAHPLWSGGNSPAARFLFPMLPLLALAASRLWARERLEGVTSWLPPLVAFSLSVSLFTLFLPGQPLYLNAKDGTGRLWEALSSSWDLTSYLPSLITADASAIVLARHRAHAGSACSRAAVSLSAGAAAAFRSPSARRGLGSGPDRSAALAPARRPLGDGAHETAQRKQSRRFSRVSIGRALERRRGQGARLAAPPSFPSRRRPSPLVELAVPHPGGTLSRVRSGPRGLRTLQRSELLRGGRRPLRVEGRARPFSRASAKFQRRWSSSPSLGRALRAATSREPNSRRSRRPASSQF